MWVVGITGMIAAGKSHAARRMADWGAVHIDADAIAAEVTRRSDVIAAIGKSLGPDVIASDGQLNRPAVAAAVFGDDERHREHLNTLESIVHPAVRVEIAGQLRRAEIDHAAAVCLDVPLLIRSGWFRGCDDVVCVCCDPSVQRRRIETRGWDLSQLRRRTVRQTDISIKQRLATFRLDTSNESSADQDLRDWFQSKRDRWPADPASCGSDCPRPTSSHQPDHDHESNHAE